jgi:hypothetical protein
MRPAVAVGDDIDVTRSIEGVQQVVNGLNVKT